MLEAVIQKCQEAGMYTPEVYVGTAQQMADSYSSQNPQYPRITFNTKEQKLRGQDNTVPELTATIGDCTSTSYFLVKDSLPKDTKASQAELTYLRPDVVSNRIATNLGIVQPPTATATIPPIPPIAQTTPSSVQGVPNPTMMNPVQPTGQAQAIPSIAQIQAQPTMSKAQMMAQAVPTVPPQGFASLATGAARRVTQNTPTVPNPYQAPTAPSQAVPPVTKNPYATMETEEEAVVSNQAAPIPSTQNGSGTGVKVKTNSAPVPEAVPLHNSGKSQKMGKINKNLQSLGNLHQNIGQALKDMSQGEINPIQLYGDTLNIIGSFINGIPAGIQEGRLQKISEQMKLVTQKKSAIDSKMGLIGDEYMSSTAPVPVPAPTPAPAPKTEAVTIPASDKIQSSSKSDKPMTEAIDQLLKSNASIDDKLAAIEKTLDKMLEQLNKIEKNLEAIQASLEANDPTIQSQASMNSMVIETEAKTEVEVVANNPLAEVATKTEIETDITAEARTRTEAAQEVEVPEVVVDSIPDEELDVGQALAGILSSYEGNLDKINQYLKQDGLGIIISDAGDSLSVKEISDVGIHSIVFSAEANGEGWDINSDINDSKKLEVLESFIEAEAAVNSEPELKPEQQKVPKAPAVEEPCLFM